MIYDSFLYYYLFLLKIGFKVFYVLSLVGEVPMYNNSLCAIECFACTYVVCDFQCD